MDFKKGSILSVYVCVVTVPRNGPGDLNRDSLRGPPNKSLTTFLWTMFCLKSKSFQRFPAPYVDKTDLLYSKQARILLSLVVFVKYAWHEVICRKIGPPEVKSLLSDLETIET